jgi:hypothetical protein
MLRQTSAGEVNLKGPKLRRQTFETVIIDRYRRRESSVAQSDGSRPLIPTQSGHRFRRKSATHSD